MSTKKVTIEVFEPKLFAASVADEIVTSIVEVLQEKEYCSLVLSGGSTPSAIYRSLSLPPRVNEVEWEKVKIFFGDERFVDHTDILSNYRMTTETLLKPLSLIGEKTKVFAVNTSAVSSEEAAIEYERTIRQEVTIVQGDLPEFDIVLLGMGEDGHTASLFPGDHLLMKQNLALDTSFSDIIQKHVITAAAKNPHDQSLRVSLTPFALLNAKRIIFIVGGESKSGMVRKVITGQKDIEKLPAQLYRDLKGQVSFYLDSAAASKLDKKIS
jgi:6-phosphogluconolactonase